MPNSSPFALRSSSQTHADPSGSRAVSWVLAVMLALVPTVGMPTELVLQDTLKSAIVSIGTLAGVWVWWWSQRKQACPTIQWHGILLLPLALLLHALGSMVWSHTYLAGVEAARWAMLGLLMWLVVQAAHPSHWMRLVWGIHWGAVGASVWTVAQFWGNLEWFPQAAAPASTFANRNFFAEYAVCALPFSVLALAQTSKPTWRQPMALLVAFNGVALMATGTRSALLALLCITPPLMLVLWRYRSQLAWGQWSKRSLAAVLIVGMMGVLTLGSLRSLHPESLGQTALSRSWLRAASMAEKTVYAEGSFSYRSMMWKGTARMLMGKPWLGVGAGAWEVYIPLYQGPSADEEPDYYAHNEYLQLLAEYGLPIGGGVLAVLLAYLLLAARSTWRLPLSTPDAPLRAIVLTSLLALSVVSLAGFPWRLASTGALFTLSLALLASTDSRLFLRDALGYGKTVIGKGHRLYVTGLLLAGSALAALTTVQAIRAEMLIVGGIHALNKAQQILPADASAARAAQARGVELLKEGLAVNAHYRKVISIASEQLASLKDWEHAAMVLQSIADSRPHIANVWSNLVLTRIEQGQAEPAMAAWRELKRLQPDTPRTRAMELLVLSRTGQEAQAIAKLHAYFDQGVVEYDMTLLAYTLGLRLHQWDLAERGLRLQAQAWPGNAADSYFRLGNVYVEAGKGFEDRALAAFRLGWKAVPAGEKALYQRLVPAHYREQL
ncbi:O-antigen ligase family protein [Rhodoferax sp.]|uniref:O-antigen ligase family protein n=1 Tax=Rhodoferax sp. TaxID=50421 RepID=UPI002ACDE4CD|nr:O-antigen ligase family protein [Rhodoferax sp.]MDZ7922397.1 O-antigen ligase family protein [Rhodoferax sp.]